MISPEEAASSGASLLPLAEALIREMSSDRRRIQACAMEVAKFYMLEETEQLCQSSGDDALAVPLRLSYPVRLTNG